MNQLEDVNLADYELLFDPEGGTPDNHRRSRKALDAVRSGGGKTGEVYLYAPPVTLTINVAIATARPVLVGGPPGCGKSTLARAIASSLGWAYRSFVVTAGSTAEELQWSFDAVQRLADAQAMAHTAAEHSRLDAANYVRPGVLWWAFDLSSAAAQEDRYRRARVGEGGFELSAQERAQREAADQGTVVLIDEIDKADPDVPNSLLVALGSRTFQVRETGQEVEGERPPLVIVTTNGERQLPDAFVRRCVVLQMQTPDNLAEIGAKHFPKTSKKLRTKLAERMAALAKAAKDEGLRPPSTAEYLDALRACVELDLRDPSVEAFTNVTQLALLKREPRRDEEESS